MQFLFSLPPCGNKHLTSVSSGAALTKERCLHLINSANADQWSRAETEDFALNNRRVVRQQSLRYELLTEYADLFYAISQINGEYFRFEIVGISQADPVQLLRYEAADLGHYDWHVDIGEKNSTRKLSFSLQLSDPEDYDGGDLQFLPDHQEARTMRTQGTLIVFPSYKTHRVTPVTRGVRYALVGWVHGMAYR